MRACVIPFSIGLAAFACNRTTAPPYFEVAVDAAAPEPRYGPACAAAIARARAEPKPPGLRSPSPTRLVVPPSPVPKSMHGSTIHYEVAVDSAGRPDAAAAVLRGVNDSGYATRFRRLLAQLQFRPAMLDGCGVPGVVHLQFHIF